MNPFLRQVANHYYDQGGLEKLCFVFPSRRAIEFFKKYLRETVVERAEKPIVLPVMTTMEDFFKNAVGKRTESRILSLLRLYDSYKDIVHDAEPLDDFVFWGDVLLGDFSDVDKYMVDPDQLFKNVADLKDIQDTFSYLTEDQIAAIQTFARNFQTTSEIKTRFLRLWNILLPLYNSFYESLRKDNIAYPGMIYRELAERLTEESAVDLFAGKYPNVGKFVFVGLNALNTAEISVLKKLRDAKIAEFCWDYSSEIIKDSHNRSSFFLDRNIELFPQAFTIDAQGLGSPNVTVVSVPSAIGQTKRVGKIAAEKGEDCAIVIPDERLLEPLLSSIPLGVEKINVTMGSPMSGSATYAFLSEVNRMQLNIRRKNGNVVFYHKQVWSIFSSGVFKQVMDEKAKEVADKIRKEAKYYIPVKDLAGSELTELIFRGVESVAQIQDYQLSLIKGIAPLLRGGMEHELEYMREYTRCVNLLKEIDLPVLPATYMRLLEQLLAAQSVPYEGKPIEGLQIMGPLETRALDFNNLVILSCNEAVFPKRSVSSSFIPPELRKCFGLPTYEFQDSVWAYYFYRMIQRAENVWLFYDSRTDRVRGGEESRYIKQIELLYKDKFRSFNRLVANSQSKVSHSLEDIEKPADIEQIIKQKKHLSASSLQSYLACQAQFYYRTVLGLGSEEEVAEKMDGSMVGNVFHRTMQDLYDLPGKFVSISYLKELLVDKLRIKSTVRKNILEELKSIEVTGRNLVMEDVICEYVVRTVKQDVSLLRRKKSGGFKIIGLELKMKWEMEGISFVGYIDRIDSSEDGVIRVVDYKTGKVKENDVEITDENAEKTVSDLFGEKEEKRPKIALQLFLYDKYVRNSRLYNGEIISNSIYHISSLFKNPIEETYPNLKFEKMTEEGLSDVLKGMIDASTKFKHTADPEVCKYCDYKQICGR